MDETGAVANLLSGVVGAVLGICWGGIILVGALKMKNLESHGYAMAGAITALVPCNLCWLLGIPFGIWALIVINRPEVREAFRRNERSAL